MLRPPKPIMYGIVVASEVVPVAWATNVGPGMVTTLTKYGLPGALAGSVSVPITCGT